ncbi:MAG: metal ABC transporter permease [Verrucomicrobia bacterium]|nr:metal ABC transporter permease [Kiritimatiellia bacterium]MCO6400943.1 metal ABC transporter permease [Verrucomicrobiota bacterium]
MNWTLLDTWMLATGIFSALSCALLGNFLFVRRLSLMGDAISHAVLPGLAAAFLITGSRDSGPMLMGAVIAGVLTAVLTQGIAHAGKVEESTSMGIVFTTLFAVGLLLIVRAADRVDLDPSCVLYGSLELTPLDTIRIGGMTLPRAFLVNTSVFAVNAAIVWLLFKEFMIGAFDPMLAVTQGFRPRWMHQLLMALVALTAVACFETVGSILVVAMLIVPAATARLLSSRLPAMLGLSLAIAAGSAILGHLGALTIPRLFGFEDTTTSGMMAVAAGAMFFLALIFAPGSGVLAHARNQLSLRRRIENEDALAALYRRGEGMELATAELPSPRLLHRLERRGFAAESAGVWQLTPRGKEEAESVIHAHVLWERFLVDHANMRVDHAHQSSERLEHVTTPEMREVLAETVEKPVTPPSDGSILPPR